MILGWGLKSPFILRIVRLLVQFPVVAAARVSNLMWTPLDVKLYLKLSTVVVSSVHLAGFFE